MTTAIKEALTSHMATEFQDPDGAVNYRKLAEGLRLRVKDLSTAVHKTTRSLEKNYKSKNISKELNSIKNLPILDIA